MAVLSPTPKMQFTSAAGVPLSGGKVYTYTAGTTTPQATFTDSTGATPNPNPIILNSRGEANIWLGSATYKFRLTDANDVEIWTVDYISAPTTALSPVLSGNVIIDSNTPGPALKITQTGTGPVLRVQDSADPDTTPFIIDTAGNLGLGTATPTAQLEATGAAKIGSLTLTSAPLPVASGGTNATTAADARTSLGAAASGLVTASGLTMATARLLGRTTASSGAVEEISVGSGLTLSAGTLVGVGGINRQTFNASGTWTKPTGFSATAMVLLEAWGAGGSGARSSVGIGQAPGGGGGAYAYRWLTLADLGATETITVGTGGAARTGSDQDGAAGGNTTIGTLLTGYGGGGGQQDAGGPGGGGGWRSAGTRTANGTSYDFTYGGGGVNTADAGAVYGGGAGGGLVSGAAGGGSLFGGAGGAAGATATGAAGAQPGGGGGGATGTSGAGGNGRVIITVFE